MQIKQISVFLENREGRLADVCELLGENNINIRALTIAETEAFGVLRTVVDKPNEAVRLITQKGFTANLTDVVAIEVDDRPGGLAAVLRSFVDADINVEYMYGFIEKSADKALMVFRFDDPKKAIELLKSHDFVVVSNSDIQSL
ncbi:phosphoglycerate dehydrogenase [Limihaloglobus sulfuriphilus]|uniref:Phosphoglycerate dehydrogenase n=1 Tax=Limihaloglobus sulfuriphilus TaxID=1851148 RepID=A0A1Q2MIS8_9BACT|nr:ACT domain-containing protein [Limihaloglobus sulfuriphilus]AQQ72569.1 phosphoglycerate dehydrogenase [Limihaloglobus sulfuriphilus]